MTVMVCKSSAPEEEVPDEGLSGADPLLAKALVDVPSALSRGADPQQAGTANNLLVLLVVVSPPRSHLHRQVRAKAAFATRRVDVLQGAPA